MRRISRTERKSMKIKDNGRSTDFIPPSFGFGCLADCLYCYCKRHVDNGLSVAYNEDQILGAIGDHSSKLGKKRPNQTHEKFWTYDISCNEDFVLHLKHHDWRKIFSYFVGTSNIFASMATKYVKKELLEFNPLDIELNPKIRVRMSLMPQSLSNELEPNTSKIKERIHFVNDLIEGGYECHLNFSPVIVSEGTLDLYKNLFKLVDSIVKDRHKSKVKCEIIFLTHNIKKHRKNLKVNPRGEELIWTPGQQESKVSTYGGENIRYKRGLKKKYIAKFTKELKKTIPWCKVRYCF